MKLIIYYISENGESIARFSGPARQVRNRINEELEKHPGSRVYESRKGTLVMECYV